MIPYSQIITGVKFYTDSERYVGGTRKYRKVFRRSDLDKLFVDISIHNPFYDTEDTIILKIFDNNSKVIINKKVSVKTVADQSFSLASIPIEGLNFSAGRYDVSVGYQQETTFQTSFQVEDIPASYSSCFKIDVLRLGRNNDDWPKIPSFRIFNINELSQITLILAGLNLLKQDYEGEFFISLFDDTGMLKETQQVSTIINCQKPNEYGLTVVCEFGDAYPDYWRQGEYRIEVVFMDQLMLVVPIIIGDNDIPAQFNIQLLQPKPISDLGNILTTDQVSEDPIQYMNQMIGLTGLKKEIKRYLNRVKYAQARRKFGHSTAAPALHAIFLGNPGTGKTSIAIQMGKTFHQMGLLSKGHVVREERNTLTGTLYGAEEEKTRLAIERAKGGVLFIDEAYNLYISDDKKDPGKRILDTLLTTLSDENNRDIMVILAGYTQPMLQLMNANPGLKSRFPHIFHFEDYNVDELMQIADLYFANNGFQLTTDAHEALHAVVQQAYTQRDDKFGNGRYIHTLLENEVIPSLATRLIESGQLDDPDILSLITKEDIPPVRKEAETHSSSSAPLTFDEQGITEALNEMDAMTGLAQVKKTIHQFVQMARILQTSGKSIDALSPLKWSLIGNTGTGKSSIAAIISRLLKAMGVLEKGHMIELKAEDLYNCPTYMTEQILLNAIASSRQGLLFIDGDAPIFKDANNHFNSDSLRLLLDSYTNQTPYIYALGIAEHESRQHLLVKNLFEKGISVVDHTLIFNDYTASELMEILQKLLLKQHARLDSAAITHLANYISNLKKESHLGYANARTMSLLAHTIIQQAYLRLSKEGIHTDKAEILVIRQDVELFVWDLRINPYGKKKIGFHP